MVKGKFFKSSSGKANKPKKGQNSQKTSWHLCQCSGSSQIPSQDDINSHQFLSLYKILYRSKLFIYDTENEEMEVKDLDTELRLDPSTSITQLSNGELFCYGSYHSGIALIIDRSYRIRMLPYGTPCYYSSTLYFDNNIYCFGGRNNFKNLALSRKFDLKNNRWINLAVLPNSNFLCNSVIFNGNILISGYLSKNLWLYSIEIGSFSSIPYDFRINICKFLINVERLYLIEWVDNRWIYESEDEYHLKPISK